MVQARQIVGIFRDRGQARLAVAETLRWGLDVHIPDALAEGAHGVHVVLHIIEEPEAARRLLSSTVRIAPRCSCPVLTE